MAALLVLFLPTLLCQVAGQNWEIGAIKSDLNCAQEAQPLLAAGNQTQCNSSEFFVGVATIGTCGDCASEPRGPGYVCSSGRIELCPNGYYCPDYFTRNRCPKGSWCRSGFIEPKECRETVICEEGSEKQLAGLGFLIGLAWFMLILCCCTCLIQLRKVQEEDRMRLSAEKIVDEDFTLGEGFVSDTPSVSIEFENLSMTLKTNGRCVLSGITGRFPSGSLVALMGPSGGGKTTFMNALCGRASYGHVTGITKINGKVGDVTSFPKLVGFVPQDDIMHPDLTVHQNLLYHALIRLPSSTTSQKAVKHVNEVIKVLGMDHIAHSVVGDPQKRGISGGQKKRVNIGMELVAMPAVIFMDEPTSGLDGAATVQLAQCLASLRTSGLTIVCVIHQPRFAVFSAFTHLLLLGAGGEQVYCGETNKMELYFAELGFRLPPRENPADWMIDIVCNLAPRYKGEGLEEDTTFSAPRDLFKLWADNYKGKERSKRWSGEAGADGEPITKDRKTCGRLAQAWVLLRREARKWNKSNFLTSCVLLFFIGAMFGALLQGLLEFSYEAIFPVLTGQAFLFYMIVTINSRSIFGSERLEFTREFNSGFSSFSYWLAKVTFSSINVYVYPLAYALPLYWVMPLPAQSFPWFYLCFAFAAWYHMGLGMVFSVTFSNLTTSLLMCVFIPMILELAFSGGMTAVKDMSSIELFLSWFTCGRWYKQEIYLREMKEYPEHVRNFDAVKNQLDNIDADFDDLGWGLLWLGILGLGLRLWALLQLALIKYSEGNTTIGKLYFLLVKQLGKCGLSELMKTGVKKSDTTGHPTGYQRQPTRFAGQVAISAEEAVPVTIKASAPMRGVSPPPASTSQPSPPQEAVKTDWQVQVVNASHELPGEADVMATRADDEESC